MRRLPLLIALCVATPTLAKQPRPPQPPPEASLEGCEWAGPGYVKLQGTETCVKIGGSVRAEFAR